MSFESPISVLQNLAGEEVAVVSGSALDSAQPGVAILAKDESGNAQFLNITAGGKLKVDADVNVTLDHVDDSVTVYGSEDVALQQSSDHANSLKTYDAYVSGAIDSMGADLNAFATANHADLVAIDGSVADVETAVTNASSAISGSVVALGSDLNAFATANHSDLTTINASVGDVETAVTNASSAISGSVVALGSDLNAFAAANHSDLVAIDSSVGDVETAVTNASSAISGSVVALGSDLNAFAAANHSDLSAISGALDAYRADFAETMPVISGAIAEGNALLSSINDKNFATETTLSAFKTDNHTDLQAVSGAIEAYRADFAETMPVISGAIAEGNATLAGFKTANHDDLVAISGSLARLTFNGSNELLVNAAVDVSLSASTDSVTVWGDRAALVQDAADDYLLVRDSDVSGAINSLGSDLNAFATANHGDLQAVSGALEAYRADFAETMPVISGAIAEGNALLSSINDKNFATEATLSAFKTDNHSDLQAVSGAIEAYRADFAETMPVISGAIAEGNALLSSINDKNFATEASLTAFTNANHEDLMAVSGAIEAYRADFAETMPVIRGELQAITSSVDLASGAISGSIVALGADLGSKLDQFNFDGSALVVTGNLNVDVSLTQADEVTAYQGGAPWSVSATDLDIRDLVYATDSVSIYGDEGVAFAQISGSGEMITVPLGNEGNSFLQAASGSIWTDVDGNGALLVGLLGSNSKNVLMSSVNDILMVSGAGNFNVTATALDIRPLTNADIVTVDNMVDVSALATESTLNAVSGAINGLGASVDLVTAAVAAIDATQLGTVTVTASNLDIRNLDASTDSVNVAKDGSGNAHPILVDGAGASITRNKGTSASVFAKNADTSADTITANPDRMGATFFMDGNATCYIKLGTGASASDFSVRLVNNGYYELPEGYTGAISVVFSVIDNNIKLRCTELTYA